MVHEWNCSLVIDWDSIGFTSTYYTKVLGSITFHDYVYSTTSGDKVCQWLAAGPCVFSD